MKSRNALLICFSVIGALAWPVYAAEMQDMPGMKPATGKSAPGHAHKGQGTVNKIDKQAAKINITHGPIQSLGWSSGMTMDFPVKDKAALEQIKPGQKVDFELVKESSGQFAITRITPAK